MPSIIIFSGFLSADPPAQWNRERVGTRAGSAVSEEITFLLGSSWCEILINPVTESRLKS